MKAPIDLKPAKILGTLIQTLSQDRKPTVLHQKINPMEKINSTIAK